MRGVCLASVLVTLVGCAPNTPPSDGSSAAQSSGEPRDGAALPTVTRLEADRSPVAPAAPSPGADTVGRAAERVHHTTPAGLPPFAPPPFDPPHERSAAPGDGQWQALGDEALGEVAAALPRVLFRSVVHPHAKSRFISLDVVAIDLRQVELSWAIGKNDHLAERLATHQVPGLIPGERLPNVLAVFNGGFQARHGWWGMMAHGITVLEPKATGCTVAMATTGGVSIAPWSALGPMQDQLLAFRQGPPCLVFESEMHPDLERGVTRPWAGTNPDRKTRRRSALGIDASGQVLYFAIGTETQPVDLARGMLAVGAANAVQLDINWAWTRFLLAGLREDRPRVTTSLMPDSLHGKNEYFSRPSDRDFFYLTRKVVSTD